MTFFLSLLKKMTNFASAKQNIGVLAHPVERNTGSVEVSSSSLLYSTFTAS